MDEKKSVIVEFFKQILLSFAVTVIAVSVAGWFVGDVTKEMGGLLGLGRDGLSYTSILQMFVFAVVTAVLKIVLFSEFLTGRMMLLWRTALMILLSFAAAVLFAVVFDWFPVNDWQAWLSFIISITASFAAAIMLMVVKTKLEDKKYSALLADYKAKQNKESEDKM